MKDVIIWLGVGTLRGLFGVLLSPPEAKAKRHTDNAIPVTVAAVRLVKVDRTIPVVGTLFPKDEATLGAEVEGRVERTMAEFGDRLTNGQVIAQIDTTTYEATARQVGANLARARAMSLNANQNLKRTRELNKS